MIEAIGLTLLGFILTETFSWWMHKYIMHGVLWKIHKTHHQHTEGAFELNDIFVLIFGGSAVILILLGVESFDYRFWLGCGISLYGTLYFILHDVLIHKRLKWFDRPRTKYIKAVTKAHRDHHKTKEKDDAVSFGLFLIPKQYFKEDRKEV